MVAVSNMPDLVQKILGAPPTQAGSSGGKPPVANRPTYQGPTNPEDPRHFNDPSMFIDYSKLFSGNPEHQSIIERLFPDRSGKGLYGQPIVYAN